MRIRKSTKKLSSSEFSGVDSPETVVCRLNQSPWDVIPLGSAAGNHLDASWFLPSSSSSSAYRFQFDGEDSFNGYASLGDSGGVESVASEKLQKLGNEATDHSVSRINNKTKKIHDPGSSSIKSCSPKRATERQSCAPPRRGRPPGSVKKPSSAPTSTTAAVSNHYEFYYYSGFGPRWGKKRGGDREGGSRKVVDKDRDTNGNGYRENEGRRSRFCDCESDVGLGYTYDDDDDDNDDDDDDDDDEYEDDEDEDEDGEIGGRKINGKIKKRRRKPVKARSLKSLM